MSGENFQLIAVLIIFIGVFVVFIGEWLAADVVALSVAGLLLILGVVSTSDVLSVFSNSGVFAIGALFVLSAALEKTGCIEFMGDYATKFIGHTPRLAFLGLIIFTLAVSAFINNTPLVVIMTPVAFRLCQHLKIAPSKMLIPLSYAAILGGTCTLVGTSTNLVVDGVARKLGQAPFSLFEITGLGLFVAAIGVIYMWTIGYRLLPDRETTASLLAEQPQRQFRTEMVVQTDSTLVGKTLAEAKLLNLSGGRVVDVIRQEESLAVEMATLRLQAGDRLLLKTAAAGVMGLRQRDGLTFEAAGDLQEVSVQSTMVVEGIVGPRSSFVQHRLADFNLQRRYGVFIIALHRQGVNLSGRIDKERLEIGDTVLLEGPADGIRRLVETNDLINLTQPQHNPIRRDKAWIALTIVPAVILLLAFEVMPIAGLAFIAAVLLVITGCIDRDEAYKSIEWRIMFLIYGMLVLGEAMERTGAVASIVQWVVQHTGHLGPWAMLTLTYLLATLLTEMVNNKAVAVLLTPIAIGVATQVGADPRPFIVAVMFGASASFATPIGYQTNTFVYGAGGYKYMDFVRIGLPLNLILWVACSLTIPFFWPLVK